MRRWRPSSAGRASNSWIIAWTSRCIGLVNVIWRNSSKYRRSSHSIKLICAFSVWFSMMVMVCMSILCTIDCMHFRPVTGALIWARWRFQWKTRNLLTYPWHAMVWPRRGRIFGTAIGATKKKRLKVVSTWGPIIGNVPFAGSKKLEHRSRVLSDRGG